MNFIGIDPGLDGAIVLITDAGELVFEDTPTLQVGTNGKNKRAYDTAAMKEILRSFSPAITFLEKQQSMPDQGVASTFSTGMGYGIWIGLLTGLGMGFELIHPRTWKAAMMRDAPKGKDASIGKAKDLFPQSAQSLKLKKHHGRADALLVAEYGRRQLSSHV